MELLEGRVKGVNAYCLPEGEENDEFDGEDLEEGLILGQDVLESSWEFGSTLGCSCLSSF